MITESPSSPADISLISVPLSDILTGASTTHSDTGGGVTLSSYQQCPAPLPSLYTVPSVVLSPSAPVTNSNTPPAPCSLFPPSADSGESLTPPASSSQQPSQQREMCVIDTGIQCSMSFLQVFGSI